MHVQERLAGRRKGEKCRCLCPICIGEIQLLGTCVQTERSKTFTSPITSRVAFSMQHSRGIRGPLWHLQNVKEDPEGPLRPRVIGLDTHLLCRLVEPSTEEKRDHGREVLY